MRRSPNARPVPEGTPAAGPTLDAARLDLCRDALAVIGSPDAHPATKARARADLAHYTGQPVHSVAEDVARRAVEYVDSGRAAADACAKPTQAYTPPPRVATTSS